MRSCQWTNPLLLLSLHLADVWPRVIEMEIGAALCPMFGAGMTLTLTKKELCHSNETWHALNSTFPDTNCIVSFQINPHWISYSRLWKVGLETFLNSLKKTLGWDQISIGPMIRSYSQLRTFWRIRMRASLPQESKCCNTDGKSVWTVGETMLKNLSNSPIAS